MAWFMLLGAGLMEVVWTMGLKYTEGFSRLAPSIVTVVAMIISMIASTRRTVVTGRQVIRQDRGRSRIRPAAA